MRAPALDMCLLPYIGAYRICKTQFGLTPTTHSCPLPNLQIPILDGPGNRNLRPTVGQHGRCGARYGIALPPTARVQPETTLQILLPYWAVVPTYGNSLQYLSSGPSPSLGQKGLKRPQVPKAGPKRRFLPLRSLPDVCGVAGML